MTDEELIAALVQLVRHTACVCTRTFSYHGTGKEMCRRCRVLVEVEERDGGVSETRKIFEHRRP